MQSSPTTPPTTNLNLSNKCGVKSTAPCQCQSKLNTILFVKVSMADLLNWIALDYMFQHCAIYDYVRAHSTKKKYGYLSMDTSKYTVHTYWRQSAGEKYKILLQNVRLSWTTESDFCFALQDTGAQSACWNTQELEWWFWQFLSLFLSVFYIPSLIASARVSLFPRLFSFSTG